MILPQWTEKYSKTEGGRDHLAYENVGVRMLERLLPGISNITKRARYYSFFAWVLYRFIEQNKLPKTSKIFRHYLKGKSIIFLFANGLLHHEEKTGIDGIRLVDNDLKENGERKVYKWGEAELKNYRDNFWVYSQKLKQLGITRDNEEYDLESLTPRGKEIAEAFNDSIKHTKYFQHYCDKIDLKPPIEIPLDVLKEYGEACHVLVLQQSSNETNLLFESFFRLKDRNAESLPTTEYYQYPDGTFKTRRESLSLYLDIINQRSSPLSYRYPEFQRIVYFSKIQNLGYKPNKKLKDNLEFWRMFQARQYFVYAVESIFTGITSILFERQLSFEVLMQEVVGKIDFKLLNKTFDLNLSENQSIQKLLASIQQGKTDEVFDNSCTLQSKLNEDVLFKNIHSHLNDDQTTHVVGCAILMLLVIYSRLNYYRKHNLPYWEFAKIGSDASLSMHQFFEELEKKLLEHISFQELLEWISKDHILMQHIYVATTKLSGYQIDTFHFTQDEGLLRGIREASPNMNALKFDTTINILTDVGLINEAKGQYKLTSKGKDILDNL